MPKFTTKSHQPSDMPIVVELIYVDDSPTITYNGVKVAYISAPKGDIVTFSLSAANLAAVTAMGVELNGRSVRHL